MACITKDVKVRFRIEKGQSIIEEYDEVIKVGLSRHVKVGECSVTFDTKKTIIKVYEDSQS